MLQTNTPYSRPININGREDADFGGIKWDDKLGLHFAPRSSQPPFILPSFNRPFTARRFGQEF